MTRSRQTISYGSAAARHWRIGLLAAAAFVAGCSGNLRLLEDGKSYPGHWNSASGEVEADIDGEHYAGTYSDPPNIGIGVGVGSYSWSGSGGGLGLSTGTGGGGGRAVLTSSSGRVIECYFASSFGRGQGECRSMDGRRFVLVIGG